MESEKVKEIKKALEFNANEDIYVLPYVDDKGEQNIVNFNDILTLINELEDENERLKNDCTDIANDDQEMDYQEMDKLSNEEAEKNQQLNDRIAELEKENAEIKNSVVMRDSKTLEEISNDKLKQFTEMLKELWADEDASCWTQIYQIDEILEKFINKLKDNSERLKELEFEYKGTQYRFIYDELEYKAEYGAYVTICEIPISDTKYANDKEAIECICKIALSVFGQGVIVGEKNKARAIREMLGINE